MVDIKQLLPLGSVVTLKKGKKKIMIIGRIQENVNTHEAYDYAACYYPEGVIRADELFLFNQADIDMVFYVGLQDHDEFAFRAYLEETIK